MKNKKIYIKINVDNQTVELDRIIEQEPAFIGFEQTNLFDK